MEWNLIDWGVIGLVSLGLIFGLLWGTLRMLFLAFCVVIALLIQPITQPVTGDLLDQFVFGRLGDNSQIALMRSGSILVLSIFMPFVILSLVLAWPFNVLKKRVNPFINYIFGAGIGGAIGFMLACGGLILYAVASKEQIRYQIYCESQLTPLVYDSSQVVVRFMLDLFGNSQDMQRFVLDLELALSQADPRLATTCQGTTV